MFIEVNDKKFEIIRGYSRKKFNDNLNRITDFSDKKGFSILQGSDGVIYLGKECPLVEFTDVISVTTDLAIIKQ